MKLNLFTLAVATLIASGPAFAQPSQSQTQHKEQARVANGTYSGQMTAGETKNVESREANLNREVRDDRSTDDGHLTQQERQQINHQQNNLSHSIYQDKHNANVAHYGNNEVGQRREKQQDRIANGLRNGSMNAGQTARVENREQGVN